MNELSKRERNYLVWKVIIQKLATIMGLVVIAIFCGYVVGEVYYTIGRADLTLEFNVGIVILLLVISLSMSILTWKDRLYQRMFEGSKILSGWRGNKGKAPNCPRVNVEMEDGKMLWNVMPNTLDWSLSAENPIVEFLSLIHI